MAEEIYILYGLAALLALIALEDWYSYKKDWAKFRAGGAVFIAFIATVAHINS